MANEIEIKLMLEAKHNQKQRLTADTLNKVTEVIRSIPALKVMAEEDLELLNLYFDTKNQDLYHHGIALRVRRTGFAYEMTIKTKPSARTAGLHVHPEYNIALDARPKVPELALFPQEVFAQAIADGLSVASLQGQIYNHMGQECRRHTMLLSPSLLNDQHQTSSIVELSLDEVTYQGQHGPVYGVELELELKDGEPQVLSFMLAQILHHMAQNVPEVLVRAGGMSKMQRSAIYAALSQVPTCDLTQVKDAETLWHALSELEAEIFMNTQVSVKSTDKFKGLIELIGQIPESFVAASEALKELARALDLCLTSQPQAKVEAFRQALGQSEFVQARIDRALAKL